MCEWSTSVIIRPLLWAVLSPGNPEIDPLLTNHETSIFSIYTQTIFMTSFELIECIKESRNDVVSVILSRSYLQVHLAIQNGGNASEDKKMVER